jgi:SAM-dependent methyltransferase
MQSDEWFKEWFDTQYYHMLYNKRNELEALTFITNLVELLHLPKGAKVADIACGKGRHSRVLASLGFQTTGFDLSHNSIESAKSLQTPLTEFYEHDMRLPFPDSSFSAAFNLFTSFGYFSDPKDDEKCLSNFYNLLVPGGFFIQDYLNGRAFTGCMPINGEEARGEVMFKYHKQWDPPFIKKEIEVIDKNQVFRFHEKVKVYSLLELEKLHLSAGFEVLHVFGNYELNEFSETESPRIIVISKRPNV